MEAVITLDIHRSTVTKSGKLIISEWFDSRNYFMQRVIMSPVEAKDYADKLLEACEIWRD